MFRSMLLHNQWASGLQYDVVEIVSGVDEVEVEPSVRLVAREINTATKSNTLC